MSEADDAEHQEQQLQREEDAAAPMETEVEAEAEADGAVNEEYEEPEHHDYHNCADADAGADVDAEVEESYAHEEAHAGGSGYHSYAPSEHLMMTTNNRRNDINELIKQREAKNEPPHPIKTKFAAPSEHLLKTTQARIAEIKTREQLKEERLQKRDIWWEERKPPKKAAAKQNVPSKLHEPTKAYLVQQRAKAPEKTTPDKGAIPKSPPTKATKIDSQSPLLRPTRNSTMQAYNSKPPPPPPPHLELSGMRSGPQNVQSKLLMETETAKYKKYKSREEQEAELRAARAANRSPVKVKAPSERLLQFNTAMRRQSRTKAEHHEANARESGWNEYFIKEATISKDREEFVPLPPVTYMRDSWEGNVDIDESQYEGVLDLNQGSPREEGEEGESKPAEAAEAAEAAKGEAAATEPAQNGHASDEGAAAAATGEAEAVEA